MLTDKERLQQILLNLLLNAIKFTSQGSILLEVLVAESMVHFKIEDTGIGIEECRLPYLFNLFEKNEGTDLQSFLACNHKSARMGLPISQNLCRLMGGHIRVKSEQG